MKYKSSKLNYTIKHDPSCGLLVLEPNDSFLILVKSAAINSGISPSEVVNGLSREILVNHSIVIEVPIFHTPEEQLAFISKNKDILFDTIINSWDFSYKFWPNDRSVSTFNSLFTLTYFNSIVDVFNDSEADFKKIDGLSLFVVKPKSIVVKWFKQLYFDKKILIPNDDILNPDFFKKIGCISSIAPQFANKEEISVFIKQNYSRLFDFALTKYCLDESLWIEDRSYKQFLKWFDCVNYSPIFSQKLWEYPK